MRVYNINVGLNLYRGFEVYYLSLRLFCGHVLRSLLIARLFKWFFAYIEKPSHRLNTTETLHRVKNTILFSEVCLNIWFKRSRPSSQPHPTFSYTLLPYSVVCEFSFIEKHWKIWCGEVYSMCSVRSVMFIYTGNFSLVAVIKWWICSVNQL